MKTDEIVYNQLLEKIEEIEPIVEKLEKEFDKKWFEDFKGEGLGNVPSFNEYWDKKQKALHPHGQILTSLRTAARMCMPFELDELPDYGDVMSLEEFKANVESGWFIDYDGYGYYVLDGKETNIYIYPSDIKKGNIREEFDTIVWYNR